MKKVILFLLVLVIVLGSVGSAAYFYNQNQIAQKMLKDPTGASKEEIKAIAKALSKFMDLPTDEEPTLATVLDKEKLKDQPFFAKAENGDKVIIYTKSGKAILYRPSTGRIIDIAPINLGESQGMVNVYVLNGTSTAGLAKTFSAALKAQATNVTVLGEDTAKKTDYAKSVVIDVTGKKAELAKQMASLIGGEVSTLPAGEILPTVKDQTIDLLVIVGANLKISEVAPATPSVTPSVSPTTEITPTPTK